MQHLKQIGRSWYVSITVPRTLQHIYGSHIREALHTKDVSVAINKKFPVVARIKAKLLWARENLRADGTLPQMRSSDLAAQIRNELREARAADDDARIDALDDIALNKAHEIAALPGGDVGMEDSYDAATVARIAEGKEFYLAATATSGTIKELAEKWLEDSDCIASTKAGYRRSLREFLKFHRREDALPTWVKRQHAMAFIDDEGGLKARGLDSKTIVKKIAALRLFWQWMQDKMHIPKGENPWDNHKISARKHQTEREERRAYSDEEILTLLRGNERVHKWKRCNYLTDLIVLGLYSGARIEELCSMPISKITKVGDAYAMRTTKGKVKTDAGERDFAFVAPAPCAVIARRIANGKKDGMLFPELVPGGYDKKASQSPVKAYGLYRRKLGVDDGADFHSFRRVVITVLTKAKVDDGTLARFVGHKAKTMAGAVYYSKLPDPNTAIETARKIVYSAEIESAAHMCAMRLSRGDGKGTAVAA